MRIEYVPNPPAGLSPDDQAIVERAKARRGAKGLIPLDLALLHAPKLADGWNALLAAVRTKTSLPEDILEIVICRTCLLNKAWHEWNGHVPKLLAAGVSEAGLSVVRQVPLVSRDVLSDRQWAVLRYAEEITRSVSVPEEVFGEIKKAGFNEQEIVEITVAAATYNMVTRFFVALDIAEANNKVPDWLPPQ